MSWLDRLQFWKSRQISSNTGADANAAQPPTRSMPSTGSGLGFFSVWGRLRLWAKFALPVFAVLFLVFPLYACSVSIIDDDPNFSVAENSLKPGQSRLAAVMAALLRREVEQHGWTANDFSFWPTAWLDDMPHYQLGVATAFANVSVALRDQIGRARGSSAADADLQKAVSHLQFDGRGWSVIPAQNPESQYLKAAAYLDAYNLRLGQGTATLDARADNLFSALNLMASDLGSTSAAIETYVRENAGALGFIDMRCDNVFYTAKGQLYAYRAILKAMTRDFESVIRERQLGQVWTAMLTSFDEAIALQPWYVMNGSPDASMLPNHLTGIGFYLLRARTQIREITAILEK